MVSLGGNLITGTTDAVLITGTADLGDLPWQQPDDDLQLRH